MTKADLVDFNRKFHAYLDVVEMKRPATDLSTRSGLGDFPVITFGPGEEELVEEFLMKLRTHRKRVLKEAYERIDPDAES